VLAAASVRGSKRAVGLPLHPIVDAASDAPRYGSRPFGHQASARLQAQALDAVQSPLLAKCVDSTAALVRACVTWWQAEQVKAAKTSV